MKRSVRLSAGVAALALAVSVSACAASGSSSPTTTLTVGFVVDPSWAQIPVAAADGDFTKHDINVKVVDFPTAVEALQAVTAGQVDIATAADVPTAAALSRSPNLRVVADGSRWNGSLIIARRSAGVYSMKDLAGKSIGTPLGTSAAYFAAAAIGRGGVQANLVQTAPSAVVTAMSQHDVSAVSIFQPYQEQVLQALGSDAVELAGGGYTQHSLYLTTQSTATAKASALSAFFAALADAGTQLADQSPTAIGALAQATQLQPALLRKILPQFNFTLQMQPDLASELTTLATWSKKEGWIESSTSLPNYSAFLDNKFIPK